MDPAAHDFSQDDLPPEDVLDHLKAHDRRMKDGKPDWALAKAALSNRYWDYVLGETDASTKWLADSRIEVNRLWTFMSSYLAALYPRANRTVMGPDPAGMGDPIKAQLVANKWLAANRVHRRVQTGLRQALLYPGVGAKIGYKPGSGSAIDRVWIRVIPWWEMLLDSDVLDTEDERFRGHVYYRPVREVEREYKLAGLHGEEREDFLTQTLVETSKEGKSSSPIGKKAASDLRHFVRVLEFINLVDTVADPQDPGVRYQGRLELYVLGQGGGQYTKPIYMGPLPLAMPDGRPVAHIAPLIFNPEPDYPYRGIPHAKRLMPQIREINAYRTFLALATRKDTRQFLVPKDLFADTELNKLTQGIDGAVIPVDISKIEGMTLQGSVIPVPNAPLSANIPMYLNIVDKDLESEIGQSPNVIGQITRATAQEVATAQQYTESDFGRHAERRDDWLAEVVTAVLRAVVAAMQDRGDSAGAFKTEPAVTLAPAQARPAEPDGQEAPAATQPPTEDEPLDTESQDLAAAVAETTGGPTPYQDAGPGENLDRVQLGQGQARIQQEVLTLQLKPGETSAVAVHDLDGDFMVSFVEGGRTPMTDAAMQQALVGLAEIYAGLWQRAQKGGADGTLARRWMTAVAERYDFPKDLHPDELEAAVQEAEAKQPTNGADDRETADTLQRALSLPPAEALQVLRALFKGNSEVLQTLERIEASPPEEQQRLLGTLFRGA